MPLPKITPAAKVKGLVCRFRTYAPNVQFAEFWIIEHPRQISSAVICGQIRPKEIDRAIVVLKQLGIEVVQENVPIELMEALREQEI